MPFSPPPIIQSSPPGTPYAFRKCCETVRDAVALEKVARRYTDLEPLGGKAWFVGRCALPDHEDKTPSFYIYPPGRWHCYGCGRGGDVVDLEFHCGDYGELWEAMVSLAVEHDVKLPERPRSWFARQERQKPVRDALEQARIGRVQRRLYRWLCAPNIARFEDEAERQDEEAIAWHDCGRMAQIMVHRARGQGA